jgi:hypothetical protein
MKPPSAKPSHASKAVAPAAPAAAGKAAAAAAPAAGSKSSAPASSAAVPAPAAESKVASATVVSAVEALLSHLSSAARARGGPASLLGESTQLHLVFRLFRTPGRAKGKPVRMCVPRRGARAAAAAAGAPRRARYVSRLRPAARFPPPSPAAPSRTRRWTPPTACRWR